MKKSYILVIVTILALSLLLAGCGGTPKSENTNKPGSSQSQDMNSGDMKNMDHSKMNMDGNKK